MPEQPIALEAYEQLAEAYSAAAETKAHNALYERPATLSLIGEVAGKRVLDAGCGPGIYSEILLKKGASSVVGIDASPKMIALATERVGDHAELHVANLAEPLDFLSDESFDLVVSPLAVDYIRDWRALFAEYYRVLKAGGRFVFSGGHPFFDHLYFKTDRYFETEAVSSKWRGFADLVVEMPTYRRPLQEVINPLLEAGFRLERILEPLPLPEMAEADPEHFAELSRFPGFLCVAATK